MKYVEEEFKKELWNAGKFRKSGMIRQMQARRCQIICCVSRTMVHLGVYVPVRVLLLLLLSSSLPGVSPSALAETPEQPLEILKRMHVAENEVFFVGKRLAMFHTRDSIIVRDELVIHHPPKGDAVKILSSAGGRRPLPPGRRRPLPPRKRISTLSREEIELITQNYRFYFSPGNTIAGQETDVVKITPRFGGRPTKRLYVSRGNGIILRTEDFDPAGNLGFVSVYTQIDFGLDKVKQTVAELRKDEQVSFESKLHRGRAIKGIEADKLLGDLLIRPTYLPVGFQLVDTRAIKHKSDAVFLRYTDGMVTFSLFESKGRRLFHMRGQRARKRGWKIHLCHDVPIHIKRQDGTHILAWSNSKVNFTLIGAVEASDLIKVAESVILAAKQQ